MTGVQTCALTILDGSRREHQAQVGACLLATVTAAAVLLASDVYEFSWRYQLPALVLLPLASMLGAAAIAAKTRFELAAWKSTRAPGRPIPEPPAEGHRRNRLGYRAKAANPG